MTQHTPRDSTENHLKFKGLKRTEYGSNSAQEHPEFINGHNRQVHCPSKRQSKARKVMGLEKVRVGGGDGEVLCLPPDDNMLTNKELRMLHKGEWDTKDKKNI